MTGLRVFRRVLACLGILFLAGVLLSPGTSSLPVRVYPGVSLLSGDMGGLDAEELAGRLQALAGRLRAVPVKLKLGDEIHSLTFAELGIELDQAATAHALLAAGRKGLFPAFLLERWRAWQRGLAIRPVLKVEEGAWQAALDNLARGFDRPARNAELIIDRQDRVNVREAQAGRKMDRAAARRSVEDLVEAGEPFDLSFPWLPVEPLVSTADLRAMRVQGLLSSFSTPYNPSTTGRVANLRLAVQALNGTMLPPGAVFSFNQMVGPRLAETGYQEAKVIQSEEFVEGIGGGVCQVSSTLYNAALLAGLPITERRRHSLPVDYVPPGRDATVAYGAIDLRFRNSTAGYLVVVSRLEGNRVVMKLFGDPAGQPTVEVVSRVERWQEPLEKRIPDPDLPEGVQVVEREGRRGYQVRVYRRFKTPDRQAWEEMVSEDTYPPLHRLIRVPMATAPSID